MKHKMKTMKRHNLVEKQYFLLKDLLEQVSWGLQGSCEDIDCDKYMYKDCLKKSIRSVLKHSFSCMPKLRVQRAAIMDLLSDAKFKRLRYHSCDICGKPLDSLDENNPITSFIEKSSPGKKLFAIKSFRTHKRCKKRILLPEGFRPSW